MKTKLIISCLAFLAFTTVVGAQNNGSPSRQKNCTGKGIAYADTNKDGICDNYENSASTATLCKKTGNGKSCGMGQRQRGMGQAQGQSRKRNFVDVDKNGICDFYEVPAKK
jgi:hypothetical protein